ncbi:MAG: hypothetical protein QXO21_03920 [Candidatus Anstonellales archaeon]
MRMRKLNRANVDMSESIPNYVFSLAKLRNSVTAHFNQKYFDGHTVFILPH